MAGVGISCRRMLGSYRNPRELRINVQTFSSNWVRYHYYYPRIMVGINCTRCINFSECFGDWKPRQRRERERANNKDKGCNKLCSDEQIGRAVLRRYLQHTGQKNQGDRLATRDSNILLHMELEEATVTEEVWGIHYEPKLMPRDVMALPTGTWSKSATIWWRIL